MRTAEEWDELFGTGNKSPQREDFIQQIQLDAMKEGMRRAAEINRCDGSCSQPCPNKQAVLSAAEQLTEEDL